MYCIIPIFKDPNLHPLHKDNGLSLLYVKEMGKKSEMICQFHPDCVGVLEDYKWFENELISMTKDKISEDAKVRIDAMVQTNDGFKISEVDLKLRGPGNILGTQQSGVLDLKIADLVEDENILLDASNDASVLLKNDSKLILNENYNIRRFILNNPINKSWNEIG